MHEHRTSILVDIEISHLKLETFTQGALGHADHVVLIKSTYFIMKIFESKGPKCRRDDDRKSV